MMNTKTKEMNIVQLEVIMNKVVTSKEEILQTSRKLIQKKGWSAVSIRSVASACDVSVGSIYNYFDSKTDLIEYSTPPEPLCPVLRATHSVERAIFLFR